MVNIKKKFMLQGRKYKENTCLWGVIKEYGEFHLYAELQQVVFHIHCAPKNFFVLFGHGLYAFKSFS